MSTLLDFEPMDLMATIEVPLPSANTSVMVKSMVFGEESKFYQTIHKDNRSAMRQLTSFIYKKIDNPPKEIDTFEKFKSLCTVTDREAIVIGILSVSYGNKINWPTAHMASKSCLESPSAVSDVIIDIQKSMRVKSVDAKYLPFEYIKTTEFKVAIPNMKHETILVCRTPSLQDEEIIDQYLEDGESPKMMELISISHSIIINKEDGETIKCIKSENPLEFITNIRRLTLGQVDYIMDNISTNMDLDISVTIEFDSECKVCNEIYSQVLFPTQLFFRKIRQ